MCGGDGTAMGGPRVAAECTCTAREFGRCARPTVRPGRNVHDDRNHGDGSDTRPRGRRTSGSLTETRVRDWQDWPERFNWSKDRTMNPCPLDGTDQRAGHVLAACIEPDGPVDADGDQALVIDDARHPTFLPGGEAARPWDAATGALVRRPRRRRCSGPRRVAPLSDEPDVTWQDWPERFDGSADRHMTPCPLDGTDQRARHVLAAGIESDGPVDADSDQALVIDDARHPTFLPGGEAARPWDAATGALVRRPRRRRCSWPRRVAHLSHDPDVAWLINGLAAKDGIEPSGP